MHTTYTRKGRLKVIHPGSFQINIHSQKTVSFSNAVLCFYWTCYELIYYTDTKILEATKIKWKGNNNSQT